MRRRPDEPFARALEELELHFAAAGGLLGLHGAPLEGAGASVWDGARSAREHGRRFGSALVGSARKLSRIAERVERLRWEDYASWSVAAAVLLPRRWPERLSAEMTRGVMGGNLTGLLLDSPRLASKLGGEPTAARMLDFCAAAAERTDAGAKAALFTPLRAECEARFQDALKAYEDIRRPPPPSRAAEMRESLAT